MRTFEEILADLNSAIVSRDATLTLSLADEMALLGTMRSEGSAEGARGIAKTALGDFTSALEHHRRAQFLYDSLDNRAGVAKEHIGLGTVFTRTGEYPLALNHLRLALAIFEDVGDNYRAAIAVANLGNVFMATGDYQQALENFHRAKDVFAELGHQTSVVNLILNIGSACANTEGHAQALVNYRIGLDLAKQLNNESLIEFGRGSIIASLLVLDQLDEAEDLIREQSQSSLEDPMSRSAHLVNSASLATKRGDFETAQQHLSTALKVAQGAGIRNQVAQIHEELRDLARKRNDFEAYIEHNNEYLRITEEIRGKEATQKMAVMESERKMEAELRERDKERALLYGALPKNIANRMIRGERVSGDHYENSCVLFLDIVGFTTMSNTMPPERVVSMLSEVFAVLDGVASAHSVTKIKTIGDSYMAVGF